MKRMLALCWRSESYPKFCTMFRAYCEIAAIRIAKQTNTSKNELFLRDNACLGYFDLSQMFFYAVRTRIQGCKLLSSRPARGKIAFTSTVGCKWTRQLSHRNTHNSQVLRCTEGMFFQHLQTSRGHGSLLGATWLRVTGQCWNVTCIQGISSSANDWICFQERMSSNKRSPYFYDPFRAFTGVDFPSGVSIKLPKRNCLLKCIVCFYIVMSQT